MLVVATTFPRFDEWSETCDVCASGQKRSRVSCAGGLVTLHSRSARRDSSLVIDGLVAQGHVHAWSTVDHATVGLARNSIGHGGSSFGEFAGAYERLPEFRRAVRECLAQGSIQSDHVRRELENAWTGPDDPDRAVIERLLAQFDPQTRMR